MNKPNCAHSLFGSFWLFTHIPNELAFGFTAFLKRDSILFFCFRRILFKNERCFYVWMKLNISHFIWGCIGKVRWTKTADTVWPTVRLVSSKVRLKRKSVKYAVIIWTELAWFTIVLVLKEVESSSCYQRSLVAPDLTSWFAPRPSYCFGKLGSWSRSRLLLLDVTVGRNEIEQCKHIHMEKHLKHFYWDGVTSPHERVSSFPEVVNNSLQDTHYCVSLFLLV
jgi:hypothetical protein